MQLHLTENILIYIASCDYIYIINGNISVESKFNNIKPSEALKRK
jgi:hypothetical protein